MHIGCNEYKMLIRIPYFRIFLLIILTIMVVDPLSVRIHAIMDPALLEYAGYNPFQFWLLINSVNWGNLVYNTLFWIFPSVIATASLYIERDTVYYLAKIKSYGRKRYYITKTITVFLFSFAYFLAALVINIAITYVVFWGHWEQTDYFAKMVPLDGTFSYVFYTHGQLVFAVFYAVLNSLTIALFSMLCVTINFIYRFKNMYLATIVPSLLLYAITFIFDSSQELVQYNIRTIIQPRAVSALDSIISSENVIITLSVWSILILGYTVYGIYKYKDLI